MIQAVEDIEHDALISVWESSVKATHDFLHEDDFIFYKELMPSFWGSVVLHCLKNDNSQIVAFMGTAEDRLEMLFVHADEIGKGSGKKLVQYALQNLHVKKVDVNQHNVRAIGFYEYFGFRVQSRSDMDGFGKPYPVLHMVLQEQYHKF